MTPTSFDVSAETFQKDVIERSKETIVVVDFWGAHCGPCLVLGPNLEKLAAESGGKWVLAKVNTTENQTLAMDFSIQGIPAVKAFKDGKVVHQFVGALPVPEIEKWLALFVPNETDDLAAEGKRLVSLGELEAAKVAFTKVGNDPRAHVGLAMVALAEGEVTLCEEFLYKVPERLIEKVSLDYSTVWIGVRAAGKEMASVESSITADKNDRQAMFDRAMLYAVAENYEDAFADLVHIVTVDRGFKDDLARIAAVRLFDVVGIHSEIANRWRGNLGRAMY